MLISKRKEGETLRIGDNIELRIVSVRKKKVIIGIIAPREVSITATRLTDVEMANTMAAANSMYIREFIQPVGGAGDREEDDPVVLG